MTPEEWHEGTKELARLVRAHTERANDVPPSIPMALAAGALAAASQVLQMLAELGVPLTDEEP